MPDFPRLHVDQPDPPAALPFPAQRTLPGRTDDRRDTRRDDTRDAAVDAEDALDRAQRALDELDRMADQVAPAIPFVTPENDDGPKAA